MAKNQHVDQVKKKLKIGRKNINKYFFKHNRKVM